MNIIERFSKKAFIDIKKKELQNAIDSAEREEPKYSVGLDEVIVEDRINHNLINKKKKVVTKSYFRIFADNIFSFFNILIFGLGILVAIAGKYPQLMFLGVIVVNCGIGVFQDIKARKLVDKLSIVNHLKSTVIRSGVEKEVLCTELVLDDIIYLKNGDQIPADCIIVKGKCMVNEAMLTGEADTIKKKEKDSILSGTYIASGSCYARVNNLGALNAAEEIEAKASTFRKPKSEILRSLNYLFKYIAFVVIILGALSLVSYWYIDPSNFNWNSFAGTPIENDGMIGGFVGSMVAMIPAGLFLLTSIALSVGQITLIKKRCLVQELYCIEMLARVDTLCLDKTGTITDGTMVFHDFIKLDKKINLDDVGSIINSVTSATKDDNYTAKALIDKFGKARKMEAKNILAFSSETKSSGAYFDKVGTYAIGAFGYVDLVNKQDVSKIVKEYSSKGYRCLVLAYSRSRIEKDKLPKEMKCLGVILLQDHIREDAPKTLGWFSENGVNIRVISGDDPITVSEIAKKAGIKDASKYVSLEGKSLEEVKEIANDYVVFGRVSPDQKEALVIALKNAGKTVAMTGDGVNDILALKRADCSIAMASGSDAAKNSSHLVLLDSNFSVLPSVAAEGRRVINNLQRTSSLFLSKTIFTIILSALFIVMTFINKSSDMIFPLMTNNYYVWEVACIGVAGFFLALEPNAAQIHGKFLKNALSNAVPISISLLISIVAFFILYIVDKTNNVSTCLGPDSYQAFLGMSSITMAIFGFVSLYKICKPFTKFRKWIYVLLLILTLLILFVCYSIPVGDGSFGGLWFGFELSWLTKDVKPLMWVAIFFLISCIMYYVILTKFDIQKIKNLFRRKKDEH